MYCSTARWLPELPCCQGPHSNPAGDSIAALLDGLNRVPQYIAFSRAPHAGVLTAALHGGPHQTLTLLLRPNTASCTLSRPDDQMGPSSGGQYSMQIAAQACSTKTMQIGTANLLPASLEVCS